MFPCFGQLYPLQDLDAQQLQAFFELCHDGTDELQKRGFARSIGLLTHSDLFVESVRFLGKLVQMQRKPVERV